MKNACLSFQLIFYLILSFVPPLFAEDLYPVMWINDGDTIALKDGRHVRYIGIDAPEVRYGNREAEAFSEKAKGFNKELVYLKKIRMELDHELYDRYGRLLAYVFLPDGTFVNLEMISRGYATCLQKSPNNRYAARLLKTQRGAMSAGKGIWRHWQEKANRYIGNRKSKRFHVYECPFGKKIRKLNRVPFSSKWDAFWTGYAPCKRCIAKHHSSGTRTY